ncbi:hypothetical protein B566_EDAN004947 [Ephemera danica]|nr:hypothetical protein B566_EDAN004947 [Ephemera danica]
MLQVRKYLLLLDSRKAHVKFWRPQMLLMVGNPRSTCPLIDFVNDLKKSGLYVLGHVKLGELGACEQDLALEETPHWLALIDHLKVKAFVELTMARSVREGMHHLVRLSGLGAMKPNTVILGFYDYIAPRDFLEGEESSYQTSTFRHVQEASGIPLFGMRDIDSRALSRAEYIGMVCDTLKLQKNVVLCRHFQNLNKASIANTRKYIDVWPVNTFCPSELDPFDESSLFMLQLACIINMTPSWKKLRLRVMLCTTANSAMPSSSTIGEEVRIEPESTHIEVRLRHWLQQLRIDATVHQVLWETPVSSAESYVDHPAALPSVQSIQGLNHLIHGMSDNTAATFIYLPPPPSYKPEDTSTPENYLSLLTALTEDLPPTVLVRGVSSVISTTL